ncbi:MAG: hypothetical protein GWN84_10190 [Gammaproteobacteria bacterium]|nr:hypothetical protein [Gammaproteobacteria bacterium]NIR83237.1 hypothetical protein [Gammaproteobacteria bacterium]NIR91041.1 hypothetical protein [Gammaproteobacteria bacterium]NIU04402.1 hypothetical protein [Gammaproteobacteria bacterium]NIV76357.1 hypothetical protein [Gammaproteobacteria bacterium]
MLGTDSAVDSRPSVAQRRALPVGEELVRELRTDHAGECGAVVIYEGTLAVTRSRAVREFAAEHLATERTHLAFMESLLPPEERSRNLPIWHVGAWLGRALGRASRAIRSGDTWP